MKKIIYNNEIYILRHFLRIGGSIGIGISLFMLYYMFIIEHYYEMIELIMLCISFIFIIFISFVNIDIEYNNMSMVSKLDREVHITNWLMKHSKFAYTIDEIQKSTKICDLTIDEIKSFRDVENTIYYKDELTYFIYRTLEEKKRLAKDKLIHVLNELIQDGQIEQGSEDGKITYGISKKYKIENIDENK